MLSGIDKVEVEHHFGPKITLSKIFANKGTFGYQYFLYAQFSVSDGLTINHVQ